MDDPRNLVDHYKGLPLEQIVADLDRHGSPLHIAIDNIERDFNMGTIVRSANAFGVRHVHIIGRRQWNKRGAMMTDKYLHVHYHTDTDAFLDFVSDSEAELIAIDNVAGSQPLTQTPLPIKVILLFGAERSGIRPELLQAATHIAAIEQFGSTRSLNVGVAAGIVMYEWLRRNTLAA